MRLEAIADSIYQCTCPERVTPEQISESNAWQLRNGVLTYGGFATDCLADAFESEGFSIVKDEISPDTDATIELDMPNVWYLNKGLAALTIPLYYNFLQNKQKVKDETIHSDNVTIRETFGRVGMVEVFLQSELELFLQEQHPMNFPYIQQNQIHGPSEHLLAYELIYI